MKIHRRKFKMEPISEIGHEAHSRTLHGRVTDRRLDYCIDLAAKWNAAHEAPYGRNPNTGTPFACGHAHDCCGCLVVELMVVTISTDGITMTINKFYNF